MNLQSMRKSLTLLLLLSQMSGSQPIPNPPFTINGRITTAEVNRGGRVELLYDLRPWAGSALLVKCIRYRGPEGDQPMGEWTFRKDHGKERLDFKKMPSGQYLFTCQLLDADQKPLDFAFRPVQLEYGGWTGRLRNYEATRKAAHSQPPLSQIPIVITAEETEYLFKVTPEALVVAPGSQTSLQATLNDRPVAENLEWTLVGPGKLQVIENFYCLYTCPKGVPSGERATIYCVGPQHPNILRQAIQVLISNQPLSPSEPGEKSPSSPVAPEPTSTSP
jgi:hypothetical protein